MSVITKAMLGYNALALSIVGRAIPGSEEREYPSAEQAYAYLEKGIDFEGEIKNYSSKKKKATVVTPAVVNEGVQASFL